MVNVTNANLLTLIAATVFLSVLHVGYGVDKTVETCDSKTQTCSKEEHDDMDSRWEKYYKLIDEALKNYVEVPKNDEHDCSIYFEQLNEDLAPFKERGISKTDFESVKEKGAHYQVINHRLFRKQYCMFEPRCKGIDHFILDVIDELPDVEFIVNDRDYPQVPKFQQGYSPKPVFSFSKTKHQTDIMYPAWSFWAGGPAISTHPTGIGRWDVHREAIAKAGRKTPWDNKISKGFFRGSRTSDQRDPLILLSRSKPNLAEAKYTKNQAYKGPKDTLNEEPAAIVTFEEHCKYKYLFNFRGVAASFRLRHLFLCNSLVFHVGEEWNEFFYKALKPWVHYIPVSESLREIEELLEFVQQNDAIAKSIAQRGFDFIWNNLRLQDVSCYWKHLLTEYAGLVKYKFNRDQTLKTVKKP